MEWRRPRRRTRSTRRPPTRSLTVVPVIPRHRSLRSGSPGARPPGRSTHRRSIRQKRDSRERGHTGTRTLGARAQGPRRAAHDRGRPRRQARLAGQEGRHRRPDPRAGGGHRVVGALGRRAGPAGDGCHRGGHRGRAGDSGPPQPLACGRGAGRGRGGPDRTLRRRLTGGRGRGGDRGWGRGR